MSETCSDRSFTENTNTSGSPLCALRAQWSFLVLSGTGEQLETSLLLMAVPILTRSCVLIVFCTLLTVTGMLHSVIRVAALHSRSPFVCKVSVSVSTGAVYNLVYCQHLSCT